MTFPGTFSRWVMIFASTSSLWRGPMAALAGLAVVLSAAMARAQDAGQEGQGPFRRLAPGVERTVPPQIQKEETATWIQKLHELGKLAADEQVPELGKRPWAATMLENVRISHDIWCLEFSYKPVRFVTVDVPTASGRVERKIVWYLVYRIRNTGEKPVRFVPQFVLHSQDTDMYYPDRILAPAMEPIRQREDAKRRLLNTVEISEVEIPPAAEGEDGSVWGVALWRDIDPATDKFSIFVKGLTNAYRIKTDEEGNWQGYSRKTLQLNFWRPGDEFFEHEGEIRIGSRGDVDYRWVYW